MRGVCEVVQAGSFATPTITTRVLPCTVATQTIHRRSEVVAIRPESYLSVSRLHVCSYAYLQSTTVFKDRVLLEI